MKCRFGGRHRQIHFHWEDLGSTWIRKECIDSDPVCHNTQQQGVKRSVTMHARGWLEKDPTRGIKIGEPIGAEGVIEWPWPVESNLRAATDVAQQSCHPREIAAEMAI